MNAFTDNYKRYDPEREGYGGASQWRRNFYKRVSPDEATRILNEKDPYEILGVRRNTTKEEVKKAYHKLAMQWHPDKNPGNIKQAEAMFKQINAAYSLLISYL